MLYPPPRTFLLVLSAEDCSGAFVFDVECVEGNELYFGAPFADVEALKLAIIIESSGRRWRTKLEGDESKRVRR